MVSFWPEPRPWPSAPHTSYRSIASMSTNFHFIKPSSHNPYQLPSWSRKGHHVRRLILEICFGGQMKTRCFINCTLDAQFVISSVSKHSNSFRISISYYATVVGVTRHYFHAGTIKLRGWGKVRYQHEFRLPRTKDGMGSVFFFFFFFFFRKSPEDPDKYALQGWCLHGKTNPSSHRIVDVQMPARTTTGILWTKNWRDTRILTFNFFIIPLDRFHGYRLKCRPSTLLRSI